MSTTIEGWHNFRDGLKAYTKTWKPAETPKAKLIFVHGFSDHCNAYYEFFPTLADRGIEVLGFDQRGWGRTCSALPPSNKGNTGSTVQVLSDISEIISSQLPSSIPLFLMGHSMGGGSTLTYAAHYPSSELSQIRGFLAESALHRQVSFNGGTEEATIRETQHKASSREIAVQQDVENDALCHNIGSLECFGGMLDRAADLETGRAKVEQGIKSLWIGHGTSDFVTSQPASKKWFEGCGVEDKEYKEYDGWYHKLHGEPGQDRFTFYNDVADWILARSGSEGPALEQEMDDTSKAKL